MIDYKEVYTDEDGNEVRRIDYNIQIMTAIGLGDTFYVPKEPIWFGDKSTKDESKNTKYRTFLVDLTLPNHPIAREVYMKQIARVDAKTKTLVYSDPITLQTHKRHNAGFNTLCGGKVIRVEEITPAQVADFNNDGEFVTRNAFKWEFVHNGKFNDAEAQTLIKELINSRYTIKTDENQSN